VLCILSANCAKRKLETAKQLLLLYSGINVVDHKRNKNAVAGVERLNIPVFNKSVTAEVKTVENEIAASL